MTNKEQLGALILDAREQAGLKQESLAQLVGCAPSYITKLEKGRSIPSLDLAAKLEHVLHLKPNELVKRIIALKLPRAPQTLIEEAKLHEWAPPEAIESKGVDRVPILGEAPAGEKSVSHDEVERWVPLPREFTKGKRAYLLRVKGDSMIPRINDGDLIVVYADDQPEKGEVVVARVDGETTIKKFYCYGDTIVLEPINPKYEKREYAIAKHEVHLRGVVKGTLWKGFLK